MKKKGKGSSWLGALAAASLAALTGLSGFAPQATNLEAVQNKIQQSQRQKQAPAPAQASVQIKDQLPDVMGGLKLGGKSSGFGIPPHIYGMYHVRRGTHKKTNK